MHSEPQTAAPTVRILHQMARSGGTVISRCLASMDKVVLLSEIHPLGLKMFNPLDQADRWYDLLQPRDADEFFAGGPSFIKAISLLVQRCEERGLQLLLRDWSHLDFTGLPFTRPGYRSLLVEALAPEFNVIRYSTVRHPLDQWLSLTRKEPFSHQLSASAFLQGYTRFAESAAQTGYQRYEEFTRQPETALQAICRALKVDYDDQWQNRWHSYTNITGDVMAGRAGGQIESLPRQSAEPGREEALTGLPDYPAALQRLGYDREH